MNEKWCINCFHVKGDYEVCPYCGYRDGSGSTKECQLPPGTVLKKRYILGGVLGQGGFGITYRAFDTALGIVVAIKEFFPSGLVNRAGNEENVEHFTGEKERMYETCRKRFQKAAACMADFTEVDGIVRVYGSFEANQTVYLAMEYVDGRTLKELLEERGTLPEPEALSVIMEFLAILGKIHKKGLMHGDIGPDNLMVTGQGKLKLIDFGSACPMGENIGMLTVKQGCSAPEMYMEDTKAAAAADIYGAGALLYEMVTGARPTEAVQRIVNEEAGWRGLAEHPVTFGTERVLKKSLSLSEKERYQTAEQMKSAISEDKEPVSNEGMNLRKRKPEEVQKEAQKEARKEAQKQVMAEAGIGAGKEPRKELYKEKKTGAGFASGRNAGIRIWTAVMALICVLLLGSLLFRLYGRGQDVQVKAAAEENVSNEVGGELS